MQRNVGTPLICQQQIIHLNDRTNLSIPFNLRHRNNEEKGRYVIRFC